MITQLGCKPESMLSVNCLAPIEMAHSSSSHH